MKLIAKFTGRDARQSAASKPPFGAGFTAEIVAKTETLEVHGSELKDAGPDNCEFRAPWSVWTMPKLLNRSATVRRQDSPVSISIKHIIFAIICFSFAKHSFLFHTAFPPMRTPLGTTGCDQFGLRAPRPDFTSLIAWGSSGWISMISFMAIPALISTTNNDYENRNTDNR